MSYYNAEARGIVCDIYVATSVMLGVLDDDCSPKDFPKGRKVMVDYYINRVRASLESFIAIKDTIE